MAPQESRPNILLVITDQQRHDWVGFNPEVPIRTPNISSLADRGISFTGAVCPAPKCGPSRSCLASGMEYGRAGVAHNHDYPVEQTTYYRRLRDDAGYDVYGVGDIDLHHDTPAWGLDGKNLLPELGFSGGIQIPGKKAGIRTYRNDIRGWWTSNDKQNFVVNLPKDIDPGSNRPANAYMAYLEDHSLLESYVDDMERRESHANTHPAPIPHEMYIDNWVGRQGLAMLRAASESTPWHLSINFVGPHAPMDVSEDMHEWYRNPDVEFPPPTNPSSEHGVETHQEIRRNYASIIENIDRWLGRYIETLRERGELDNTIVVFTSDHGELLGDHGGWAKASPRHQSVGVPMVIAGPGVQPRDPVSDPVTTLDLHSTFLDYACLDSPNLDSQSMRPFFMGDASSHREIVRSGLDPWRMVFDGRYKLILGYDTETDPAIVGDATIDMTGRQATSHLFREQIDPILFDMETDPEETTNIADDNPQLVDGLSTHFFR